MGERSSRFFRNVHFALGGIALVGASVVAVPVVAAGMNTFAAWEGVHGAAWEGARRHFQKKRQTKSH